MLNNITDELAEAFIIRYNIRYKANDASESVF